jgi:1-acyl-sn-glycerol-3-phosphate acyltransferase
MLMVTTSIVCWPFMFLCNRTIVIGRENMPRHHNVLVIANHATMIDSWWIVVAAYFPWILWKPNLQPYHVPEEDNFCKGPVLTILCKLWRCIPIKRKTGDFLRKKWVPITAGLREAHLVIFPSGTRDRNAGQGQITEWKDGLCHLARACNSKVVPVGFHGIHEVLPIGSRRPRCGKTIVIVIGQPFTCSDLPKDDRDSYFAAISQRTKNATQEALTAARTRWLQEVKHPSLTLLLLQQFERLL